MQHVPSTANDFRGRPSCFVDERQKPFSFQIVEVFNIAQKGHFVGQNFIPGGLEKGLKIFTFDPK